ncbi:MAG: bifunctional (p)ppGpp synthetase/guanosine-3',5'-bis(diphosphate) 3'-pyrophosphohydrolase [Bacilli bacterium]
MENQKIIRQNGGYPMHTFENVKELYYPYIHDKKDRTKIQEAYDLVCKKHAGIFRKSGEPYIQHLIEVCYICAQLQSGPVTLEAALLHDVVEDTDETIEQINELFGSDCAKIVDSLTKIQRLKLSHRTQEEFVAEDHRKIFLGMAKDVRVIIIKLADRLHNMRTIEALSQDRQNALSNETLEVFAPIAHRLGMYRIESELEDLSLKVLKPDKYDEILKLLNEKIRSRSKSLDQFKKKLADIVFKAKIPFEIEARVKSIYSIYHKMYDKGKTFNEIYDVLALRIITETEINCYEILGLIHQEYKPIPGRFKDYIAVPKSNLYQSLHTTIMAGDGNIYEVQIRTKQMDDIAETGVAAHWRYKEGGHYNPKNEQKEIEEKLHWFRDFVSVSSENKDASAQEYMENLSKDIFDASVFVFTPKGKVIDLPNGSTPLDMAYKIHTKVGDSAVGAIVNNILVPLGTVLKTGDVVEIKTSKTSQGPNEGWLNLVKTSSAKNHIKKFLQKRDNELLRDDKIQKGRQLCIDAFKERGIDEKEMNTYISTDNVLNNYYCKNIEDLFVAICSRNPNPSAICDFLNLKRKDEQEIPLVKKSQIDSSDCPVYLEGASGVKITLGNCCTPIPGDDIVGYITKGMGVTVHRKECPNIKGQQSRLIDVYWKDNITSIYPVDIEIDCNDRNNLIVDLMNTLTANKVKVTELSAKIHDNNTCTISCQIYVNNLEMLNHTFQILKNISDVYTIKRIIH